jgi:hypothetical protein
MGYRLSQSPVSVAGASEKDARIRNSLGVGRNHGVARIRRRRTSLIMARAGDEGLDTASEQAQEVASAALIGSRGADQSKKLWAMPKIKRAHMLPLSVNRACDRFYAVPSRAVQSELDLM